MWKSSWTAFLRGGGRVYQARLTKTKPNRDKSLWVITEYNLSLSHPTANLALYWWRFFLNRHGCFWVYPIQKKTFPLFIFILLQLKKSRAPNFALPMQQCNRQYHRKEVNHFDFRWKLRFYRQFLKSKYYTYLFLKAVVLHFIFFWKLCNTS